MGAVEAFANGVLTPVAADGASFVVVREGDAWYAFPDRCTHAKRPLSDGSFEAGVVTCVYHGATFDLNQGGRATMPAIRALTCHSVVVEGDEVFVEVD